MFEFSTINDDFYKYEVKIKCLSVSFDGTFRKRIITIYVRSWQTALTLLERWNWQGRRHFRLEECTLPLYQYSLEK
jgi:hypothetical protein